MEGEGRAPAAVMQALENKSDPPFTNNCEQRGEGGVRVPRVEETGPGLEASPTLVLRNRSWRGLGSPFSTQARASLLHPRLDLRAIFSSRPSKGVRAPPTLGAGRLLRARGATWCCRPGHQLSASFVFPGLRALIPTPGRPAGGPRSPTLLWGRLPGSLDRGSPPGLQRATRATFCFQVRGYGSPGQMPGSRRQGAPRPGPTVPHNLRPSL